MTNCANNCLHIYQLIDWIKTKNKFLSTVIRETFEFIRSNNEIQREQFHFILFWWILNKLFFVYKLFEKRVVFSNWKKYIHKTKKWKTMVRKMQTLSKLCCFTQLFVWIKQKTIEKFYRVANIMMHFNLFCNMFFVKK